MIYNSCSSASAWNQTTIKGQAWNLHVCKKSADLKVVSSKSYLRETIFSSTSASYGRGKNKEGKDFKLPLCPPPPTLHPPSSLQLLTLTQFCIMAQRWSFGRDTPSQQHLEDCRGRYPSPHTFRGCRAECAVCIQYKHNTL